MQRRHPMTRSGIKRGKPLERKPIVRASTPIKRSGQVRKVSKARARQMRRYVPLMLAFLEAHPWCMCPIGCDQPSDVVHHRRGRRGARLLDQAWWAASCHDHNMWAEEHTGEALDCGWLVRIEGVDPE